MPVGCWVGKCSGKQIEFKVNHTNVFYSLANFKISVDFMLVFLFLLLQFLFGHFFCNISTATSIVFAQYCFFSLSFSNTYTHGHVRVFFYLFTSRWSFLLFRGMQLSTYLLVFPLFLLLSFLNNSFVTDLSACVCQCADYYRSHTEWASIFFLFLHLVFAHKCLFHFLLLEN